jgi:2-(1,2-epoxy-1,2-dihydrophenyl)acetyl-CoA isomerase
MPYETILYEVTDSVATITLNRPDKYNAFTSAMYKELIHAFKAADRDTGVRAIVLTGAGKGFCAGQDLDELQPLAGAKVGVGEFLRTGLNVITQTMRSIEKPILGAINGVAAGAGASIALATDLRIASADARFVFAAFVNIGVIPDAGGTYLLQRLVGTNKALELALLADGKHPLLADEALRLNIVNRVVPSEQFAEETRAFATRLASMATLAVGRTKRAIYAASERTLAEALEYEAQVQDAMFATHDFKEGVAAFIEKRPANFTGN